MSRLIALLYGAASYAVFLATFLYAIAFVAGFGVPKHVDNGADTPFLIALGIDLVLLALFSVQHSGMARPAFKRWWTRFVPQPVERSTFVLISSLVLILLFWQWRPLPQLIWSVDALPARWALLGLSALGWLLVLSSTFLINHFDLFGLRQVWLHLIGRPYTQLKFGTPFLYRFVRHPLYVGWLLVFWSAPVMTAAHLLFAVMTTGYIFVAIQLEERDLVQMHPEYAEYKKKVPMMLPVSSKLSSKPELAIASKQPVRQAS
jgi:protein-S-isoprenylcysteine O-methyltransferase Ste14